MGPCVGTGVGEAVGGGDDEDNGDGDRAEEAWSTEESIFFSRCMSDTSDLYLAGALAKRIAHMDIERIHGNLRAPEKSGVGSFFEDDTDAMSVTTLLEQRMHVLLDSFVFYASMASPIEVCKKNAFHKFVVDARIVSEAAKAGGGGSVGHAGQAQVHPAASVTSQAPEVSRRVGPARK